MSSREDPRYVRFGYLPRTGRSKNAETWRAEAGVSVYPGRLDKERGFIVDSSGLSTERGLATLVALAASDNPAFFIVGEEVGKGGDGEPVVKVEHCWPVPREVSITSFENFLQPPLEAWSRGPRDGSGHKHLRHRLQHYADDFPEGIVLVPPEADGIRTKRFGVKQPGHKRKAQKQARKKQRAKKR